MKNYSEIVNYPELMKEFEIMNTTSKYLSEIGYTTMRNEDYEKMVHDVKNKQTKLNSKK